MSFAQAFVDKALLLVAVGMVFGAIMQYREYRMNPAHVKLSKPVTMLLVGLALYGLSHVPMAQA